MSVLYNKMLELDVGRPNIEAPVVVSVGRRIVHMCTLTRVSQLQKVKEVVGHALHHHLKEKGKLKTDKKPKKTVYKSQKQELIDSRVRFEMMQLQHVENQVRFADAVEAMTGNNAQHAAVRTGILGDIRDTVKALLQQLFQEQ